MRNKDKCFRVGSYKVRLEASPNQHGFGMNWTLMVENKHGSVKSFFLGQDAKVASRMMGMRLDEMPSHYESLTGSREWDVVMPLVAEDFLKSVFETDEVTEENLDYMFKAESWSLHAGGG